MCKTNKLWYYCYKNEISSVQNPNDVVTRDANMLFYKAKDPIKAISLPSEPHLECFSNPHLFTNVLL